MVVKTMERLGVSPSLLGFGCMRLPLLNPARDGTTIDEPAAERLLDRAMAGGVTYYDTAVPYHGGTSEAFVGRALKKYDRGAFYLATKLPVWKIHSAEEAAAEFEAQLSRLQTDYIDFYLLHALGVDRWEHVQKLGLIDLFEGFKKQGKIRHLGFSFHDSYDCFEEILRAHSWDFCQIQLNYMDVEFQAGLRGAHLAESLGVPVVVMEPVKGGNLAGLPDFVYDKLEEVTPGRSPSGWALRWVASQSPVKVVLSGMSSDEQLEDNLATFTSFEPLSDAELAAIDEVRETMMTRILNGCTGCRYCMPCPFGANIPQNFRIWNDLGIYGVLPLAKRQYNMLEESARADRCQECGACEPQCPQAIPIRRHLARAAADITA